MKKLKVGDRCIVVENSYGWSLTNVGVRGVISHVFAYAGGYLFIPRGTSEKWNMRNSDLKLIDEESTTESQSKKIKQALRKICLSGLVIKSEKIISKVKEEIGTDYVFGDTILRALRQLRQDGEVNYTADKRTREYTFK